MKAKKRSSINAISKWLLILPLIIAIFIVAPSCKGKNKPSESEAIQNGSAPPPQSPYNVVNGDTVWFRVDVLPVFAGGNEALTDFLFKNISYPEAAKKKKIQGRVVIGFILTKECKVTDAKVIRELYHACDDEALRVVSSLPEFEKPALVNGRPVAYHYTLPVHFALN